ncbi:MAG: DOMON-like domain-containing protein [Sinobacteraceae bacterium]|nr:DOMON-like domain-containing protein [Nevskiaceae bacterium]MBV8853834.1 DOMON-like domain-containing protein [Nevskiaceae bacterium]
MPARAHRRVALVGHPGAHSSAIHSLEAQVTLRDGAELLLHYVLRAELARLRIPPPAADPGRVDELWRHTCFEAFVSESPGPGYLELNFSPAGSWAAYAFDDYRQGMRPAQLPQLPRIELARQPQQLELHASVQLPRSATAAAARSLRIAVTAVIEDVAGSLYYWSARHPAGKADFHHPDNLLLELTP